MECAFTKNQLDLDLYGSSGMVDLCTPFFHFSDWLDLILIYPC